MKTFSISTIVQKGAACLMTAGLLAGFCVMPAAAVSPAGIQCISVEDAVQKTTGLGFSSSSVSLSSVSSPESGCVVVGIQGSYLVDESNAIVKEINRLRYEAYKKGITYVKNGKQHKITKYVPIKWSSSLEQTARLRAVEASVTLDHKRLNGKAYYTAKTNGVAVESESLGWGFDKLTEYKNGKYIPESDTKYILRCLESMSSEKNLWVKNHNASEAGHYLDMINPEYTYVGAADFYSKNTRYRQTLCLTYSSRSSLSGTKKKGISDCIAKMEVKKSYLTGSYNITGDDDMTVGDSEQLYVKTAIKPVFSNTSKTNNVIMMNPAPEWESSRESVVSVSSSGTVKAKSAGKAKITASIGTKQISTTIRVS